MNMLNVLIISFKMFVYIFSKRDISVVVNRDMVIIIESD